MFYQCIYFLVLFFFFAILFKAKQSVYMSVRIEDNFVLQASFFINLDLFFLVVFFSPQNTMMFD